jgi:hypothetical protein
MTNSRAASRSLALFAPQPVLQRGFKEPTRIGEIKSELVYGGIEAGD